jgi:hypothetical protein
MTFDVDAGELKLAEWLRLAWPGPGVLVLDGVLAVNVRVGDRIAAELIAAGDLLQATGGGDEELLSCDVGWRALVPSRFAVLDAEFGQRVQPWPQIIQALLTPRRARCGETGTGNRQRFSGENCTTASGVAEGKARAATAAYPSRRAKGRAAASSALGGVEARGICSTTHSRRRMETITAALGLPANAYGSGGRGRDTERGHRIDPPLKRRADQGGQAREGHVGATAHAVAPGR